MLRKEYPRRGGSHEDPGGDRRVRGAGVARRRSRGRARPAACGAAAGSTGCGGWSGCAARRRAPRIRPPQLRGAPVPVSQRRQPRLRLADGPDELLLPLERRSPARGRRRAVAGPLHTTGARRAGDRSVAGRRRADGPAGRNGERSRAGPGGPGALARGEALRAAVGARTPPASASTGAGPPLCRRADRRAHFGSGRTGDGPVAAVRPHRTGALGGRPDAGRPAVRPHRNRVRLSAVGDLRHAFEARPVDRHHQFQVDPDAAVRQLARRLRGDSARHGQERVRGRRRRAGRDLGLGRHGLRGYPECGRQRGARDSADDPQGRPEHRAPDGDDGGRPAAERAQPRPAHERRRRVPGGQRRGRDSRAGERRAGRHDGRGIQIESAGCRQAGDPRRRRRSAQGAVRQRHQVPASNGRAGRCSR